jgi:hypothetical protein
MRLMTIICFMILSGFVTVSCCGAFQGIGNWTGSDMLIARWMPQIRAHGAFYPHPHLRDVKALAKRGKILVITLVVSAGLMVLVSTAVLRSGKEKEKVDAIETIVPAELRAWVTAAAAAGRRGLPKGREQALNIALSAYASARGVEWRGEVPEYSPSVTCNIGRDRVTVAIPNDGAVVEVRAICGNIGANAVADAEDGSIRSSIFTSHALDREAGI